MADHDDIRRRMAADDASGRTDLAMRELLEALNRDTLRAVNDNYTAGPTPPAAA